MNRMRYFHVDTLKHFSVWFVTSGSKDQSDHVSIQLMNRLDRHWEHVYLGNQQLQAFVKGHACVSWQAHRTGNHIGPIDDVRTLN